MSVYFWGDTHFNHEGILHYCSRPWKTVGEMNKALVESWNAVVLRENDEVWHLGDFGMHAPNSSGAEDLGCLFWRLRGKKHLVIGNHDVKNQQIMRLPWETIEQISEVKKSGRRLVLCHYPLESWAGACRGAAHLHGHCHGTLKRKAAKRFDVGVDVHPAGPVSWDEVWSWADKERFEMTDHHGESR